MMSIFHALADFVVETLEHVQIQMRNPYGGLDFQQQPTNAQSNLSLRIYRELNIQRGQHVLFDPWLVMKTRCKCQRFC